MKNDAQNIPAEVFDWLEKYDFNSLTDKQKAEALAFFSAEEYEEMHQGVKSLLPVQPVVASSGRIGRKQELLNRFDEKYKRPAVISMFLRKQVPLWQAAAVFLIFSGGWMSHYILQGNKPSEQTPVAGVDTVYISRASGVTPMTIFDTIFISRQIADNPESKNSYRKPDVMEAGISIPQSSGELNVVSLNALDSMPNKQKSNSIKDDELIRKYSFTTFL